MTKPGYRIDPADPEAFRRAFHELADACLDRVAQARELPWIAKPADMAETVALVSDEPGLGEAELFAMMRGEVMPYATGNTHPRFFGWVHGTGQPVGVAAEMVAAAMNSNLGGRDHGAMAVEQAVIDWSQRQAGLPEGASGVLTTGTSQATILALSAARMKLFGDAVRKDGIAGLGRIRVYSVTGAHACIEKAMEVMGHGSRAVRHIPQGPDGAMDMEALEAAIAEDRAARILPMAVVGTAGSVNTGTFDRLDAIAGLCGREGLWFHVDGAFGFWAVLAEDPWRELVRGVDRADSIAADFHKWIGVPYDCGMVLMRDGDLHRRTFSTRPAYLEGQGAGVGGGETWFTDYGLELSRGFRALKVWAAIKAAGVPALSATISDNCRQAALMAELVEVSEVLELAQPVQANVCCFYLKRGEASAVATALQLSGEAVFSTTTLNGRECLRAAIVNHRTTEEDIRLAVAAVEREVRAVEV